MAKNRIPEPQINPVGICHRDCFLLLFSVAGIVFSFLSLYTSRFLGIQNIVPVVQSRIRHCVQEPSTLEKWIRPQSNLINTMNDSELFWRASFVPRIKEGTRRGPCIHSLRSYQPDFRTRWAFYGRQIPSQDGEKDQAGEKKKAIVVGPWGGNGGTNWDDGSYHGVREITLKYGRCIDSICVVYDKNGKPVSGEKHGGSGGNGTAEIKLQFPEEFLTTVSGHYSPVARGGSPVIRSLTFKSNRRTLGPFGVEEGTPFSFPMEGGQIVGFKGRSGWYLDAIGFHISRHKTTKVMQKVQQRFRRLTSSVPLAVPKDSDETRVKVMKAPA